LRTATALQQGLLLLQGVWEREEKEEEEEREEKGRKR
jgi:hypothetical protein